MSVILVYFTAVTLPLIVAKLGAAVGLVFSTSALNNLFKKSVNCLVGCAGCWGCP